MTGEPPPPTHRTPEDLIALLIAALLALVTSLIDATLLPTTSRTRLHEAFADLFARLEAAWIKLIQQQRARNASKQPKPITSPTTTPAAQPPKPPAQARRQNSRRTPAPTTTTVPVSAPAPNPPTIEAPHPKRAPEPHHPTRAPYRAVAPSTGPAVPHPRNFQKAAPTTPISYAQIVTITKQKTRKARETTEKLAVCNQMCMITSWTPRTPNPAPTSQSTATF